jgi:cytosine deaminase
VRRTPVRHTAPALPAPERPAAGAILRAATLADGSCADVRVSDGRIAAVAEAGTLQPRPGEQLIALDGYLLLPAFAEPHAHLDKAYTADFAPNPSDDLDGAVSVWRDYSRHLTAENIALRARRAVLSALARGTTAIRTHVGGPGVDLSALDGLLAVREDLRELVDLQIVVMGHPLSGPDRERARADMRRALELGADVVGGVPHGESNPAEAIAFCLELAAEFGRPVDLHMDEHLREDVLLGTLAQQVADGFAGNVNASHCVSLGMRPADEQRRTAAELAATGVTVVCCPATNLWLQGRAHPVATPRGLTALGPLLAAGVVVAGGGDNVQDPFNPLGSSDPLDTAQLLMLAGHLSVSQACDAIGPNARRAMGLPVIKVVAGAPADLVAVAAGSLRELVASRSADRIVLKAGRVVSWTSVTARHLDADPFDDASFGDAPFRDAPFRDAPFRDDGPFRDGPFGDGVPALDGWSS